MIKIGLLSDTHGEIDDRIFHHFKDVNEIWHAGDIGAISVIDQLKKFKPSKFVYGNIDNTDIRNETSEYLFFEILVQLFQNFCLIQKFFGCPQDLAP